MIRLNLSLFIPNLFWALYYSLDDICVYWSVLLGGTPNYDNIVVTEGMDSWSRSLYLIGQVHIEEYLNVDLGNVFCA